VTRDAANVKQDAANREPEVDPTKPEFVFTFSFVTAGRVSKIIGKLKSTEEMGVKLHSDLHRQEGDGSPARSACPPCEHVARHGDGSQVL
jgi:hypothetical protein